MATDPDVTPDPDSTDAKASRRLFLKGVGAAGIAAALPACSNDNTSKTPPRLPTASDMPTTMAVARAVRLSVPVTLKVNGQARQLSLDPRTSLLDALRDHIDLTGTKKGCNQGACGACTVLVDGERINSCLALAIQYEGRDVTTVEGLGTPEKLHKLQEAFLEHDGYQCGYCTSGQLCSAVGMAKEAERGLPSAVSADVTARGVTLTRAEIQERMSGNLCRCGAYNGIVDAISSVYAKGASR